MHVAIVILNWNGRNWLERFLPAVIAQSPNAEVIIADNASTDDSLTWLSSAHPSVRVIELTTNLAASTTTGTGGTSQAFATAAYGNVNNATATSAGRGNASITAQAVGNGPPGAALAMPTASGAAGRSAEARADAPVDGYTLARSGSTFSEGSYWEAVYLPNLSAGSNGVHAFSYADGAPPAATVAAALAAHPGVAAALDPAAEVHGMGVMGANYGDSATGSHSYYASATNSAS